MHRRKSRVSIHDVAKAANVSPPTVSNALSGKRYVSPELVQKVQIAARELGYKADPRATSFRTGRSNCIAVLSPMTAMIPAGRGKLAFLMEIAESAAIRSLESDFALTIIPPTGMPSRIVGNLLIDGAIVVEPAADDEAISALLSRQLPVVTIGQYQGGSSKTPYIDMNYNMMTKMCLEHLKEAGCKRVALILGTALRQLYHEIYIEYEKFCLKNGSPLLCERVDEFQAERAGELACDALFERDSMIDGLFAPLATLAVGARKSLQRSGRRVPDDVKILTRYDGVRARDCDPPLSAVDLHLDRVGEEAVDLLLRIIANERVEATRSAPDPLLIVRQSTMAFPA